MTTNIESRVADGEAVPYRGNPLPNVLEDLVILTFSILIMAMSGYGFPRPRTSASVRCCCRSATAISSICCGSARQACLSRHRHAGPVSATTLRGRWHYLEHDWWAEEGSFAFEPPGDIHTLVVPEGVEEMITLFHVTGAYIYVDPDGNPTGVEDVFSKLELARKHYEAVGLGADFADQFIR